MERGEHILEYACSVQPMATLRYMNVIYYTYKV